MTTDELHAWDQYAAAALATLMRTHLNVNGPLNNASDAARHADALLTERRARTVNAPEPGVPTVDECERIAYRRGRLDELASLQAWCIEKALLGSTGFDFPSISREISRRTTILSAPVPLTDLEGLGTKLATGQDAQEYVDELRGKGPTQP